MFNFKTDYKGVIVLSIVSGAVVWFLSRAIKKIAPDVVKAIDPLNENNFFASGFDKYFWKPITGSENTIGQDIYDHTHIDTSDLSYKSQGSIVSYRIDPVSGQVIGFGNDYTRELSKVSPSELVY